MKRIQYEALNSTKEAQVRCLEAQRKLQAAREERENADQAIGRLRGALRNPGLSEEERESASRELAAAIELRSGASDRIKDLEREVDTRERERDRAETTSRRSYNHIDHYQAKQDLQRAEHNLRLTKKQAKAWAKRVPEAEEVLRAARKRLRMFEEEVDADAKPVDPPARASGSRRRLVHRRAS